VEEQDKSINTTCGMRGDVQEIIKSEKISKGKGMTLHVRGGEQMNQNI